ncbi:MAG: DUF3108 domain-containing protein [Alphaproteobacteria bacterium]|nr:DUF3108 domain-containing protein [Alphaproteobacteria bacterium]MBV9695287.1 DUF3108 domain-containing protein [Alphaproteobacteria bacterium]
MTLRGLLYLVLLAPTAALAAGGESADAPSGPASELSMAMTLYAGGVSLGKVDMDATIRGDAYHVVSNLQTSGIVNAFWQAQIQAISNGRVASGGLKPQLYDSFDTNHTGKKQQVSLTYENDAPPRLYANPKFANTGYDVKPDLEKDTVDPLSAVVLITSGAGAKPDNPCAVTAPVFDGRRRYNIEMEKVGDAVKKMDNGLYSGHVTVCEIRYRQLAGFKPKLIKENEKFPKINAWVATFPSAIAGRSYAVPLRVWADTPYGVVAAVATSIKIDGEKPR